jgi:hypothetical protein
MSAYDTFLYKDAPKALMVLTIGLIYARYLKLKKSILELELEEICSTLDNINKKNAKVTIQHAQKEAEINARIEKNKKRYKNKMKD